MKAVRFAVLAIVLSCPATLRAAIDPIIRYSEVRATAMADGDSNTQSEIDAHFDAFNETAGATAVSPSGSASASAIQQSDPSDELGRISASGGAAASSLGLASSSALSVFRYSFEVLDEDLPVILTSAIAQTGDGDVWVSFKDVSLPEPTFYARRSPAIMTGPATAIEDYTLLAGHTYDIEINATSPTGQIGTTSYTFTITPVPEPGALAALAPVALLLARRRRSRSNRA